MKRYLVRHIVLTRLAALVLLTVCFIRLPARAMQQGEPPAPRGNVHLHTFWGPAVGLARGQTLRYTWVNLNDPDPEKREFEPLRIQARLVAADGSVIVQTEAAAVEAGRFQSFDFNRDQINLPGEPGTGRLQVRLEVTVMAIEANRFKNLTFRMAFDDAAEVIDTLTGQTTVSFKPKEIVVVGSKINEK